MTSVSPQQENIIQAIDGEAGLSHWRDWRWQMKHILTAYTIARAPSFGMNIWPKLLTPPINDLTASANGAN